MRHMETGKQRTNMGATNAGKGEEELEPVIVPVEELELEIGLVEERELAIGPAVGELELVRVAVAQRTRLGTAAHRRGLVPVPKRVEDLAAAAETTREPAAIEAATAWAAVDVAVAEEAEDKRTERRKE